ncbi:hypothetical protein [Sphingobacterium deserti]|uniref:Uncharacterized protein n=1 Tax=Sphingobacterium deserti TaxID=1229276 RepID=A0A0B8T020_9SPHI|nr:hypothetical protein [Sphingobacterium deserti]KGE13667.1 hypothetical protein DI53_2588 [Sphingobacterium deserti]
MNFDEFLQSIDLDKSAPKELNIQLRALWYDGKGDWKSAHDLIDHLEDRTSAHVHAYLHRVEGDLWNAKYWYGRAKQPVFEGDLADEWQQLVKMLLG